MAAVHVPAWKRLGLELANNQAQVHDTAPLPKKRKIERASSLSEQAHEDSVEEEAKAVIHPKGSSESKRKERKKSVSFAAGTASEKPNITYEVEAEDEASKEVRRKRKREAREIRRNKQSESQATAPGDDKIKSHLAYLSLYYSNRIQWKFNKSTQSSLLKDCFNLYRVPPEYGPALMAYISGLQGHAARARLAEEARNTIDGADKAIANLKTLDPMNLTEDFVYTAPPAGLSEEKAKDWEAFMEWKKDIYAEWNAKEAEIAADPEKAMIEHANRHDFIGHMRRHQLLDDETRRDTIEYKFEMLKKRRGEQILNAVKIMMDAMVVEEREKKQQALIAVGKSARPQNDALAPKIVNKPKKSRGRKRRTAAADDTSSSSDSSDDD